MREANVQMAFCQEGLFKFFRLPLGLWNASVTLQWALDLLMAGLTWDEVSVYLDNLVIFALVMLPHFSVTDRSRPQVEALCFFRFNYIKYLGHVVSQDGIQLDCEDSHATLHCAHQLERSL